MSNKRIFYQHWLIKLVLPALPWLVVMALLSLLVGYVFPYFRHALWLFILAVYPILKLIGLYLAWRGYSIAIVAGSGEIVERSELFRVSERRVPLGQLSTVEYTRPWWASFFRIDIADAAVSAMGGPLVLSSMGNFSDLWTILESKGKNIPPKPPSFLIVLLAWMGRSAFGLGRLTFGVFSWLLSWGRAVIARQIERYAGAQPEPTSTSLRRPAPAAWQRDVLDGGYVYRGIAFSQQVSSYAGFCAFCEQFILGDKNWTRWRYHTRDPGRKYYPDGISEQVAGYYLRRLREEFILIPVPNGSARERLACRIHSIKDIQSLVPNFPGPWSRTARGRTKAFRNSVGWT